MSMPIAVGDPRLVGPALRAFTQIAEAWSLTEAEQSAILGLSVDATFAVLSDDAKASTTSETMERVSYVLGIYRALHGIFPNQQQADGWIRRPNNAALFRDAPALALMCSGQLEDLASVRQYLDAQGLVDP